MREVGFSQLSFKNPHRLHSILASSLVLQNLYSRYLKIYLQNLYLRISGETLTLFKILRELHLPPSPGWNNKHVFMSKPPFLPSRMPQTFSTGNCSFKESRSGFRMHHLRAEGEWEGRRSGGFPSIDNTDFRLSSEKLSCLSLRFSFGGEMRAKIPTDLAGAVSPQRAGTGALTGAPLSGRSSAAAGRLLPLRRRGRAGTGSP